MTAHYSPTPTASASAAPTTSRSPPRRSAIVDLIAALIDDGGAYAVAGRRLLPRPPRPRLRRAVASRHRPAWTRARTSRAPTSRRTRSTSRCGRRRRRARTRVGRALGPRPAGLAHRVLGDGRGAAGGRLRDPRRRLGPGLPPPRERGGADAVRRAAPSSRASGCTTACCRWATRRWPSPSATSRCSPRCSSAGVARRCCSSSPAATTASRSCSAPRRCGAARRACAGSARPRGGCSGRALTRGHSAVRERFFAALAEDFNTSRALAAVASGSARPTAARASATDLRGMLDRARRSGGPHRRRPAPTAPDAGASALPRGRVEAASRGRATGREAGRARRRRAVRP